MSDTMVGIAFAVGVLTLSNYTLRVCIQPASDPFQLSESASLCPRDFPNALKVILPLPMQ